MKNAAYCSVIESPFNDATLLFESQQSRPSCFVAAPADIHHLCCEPPPWVAGEVGASFEDLLQAAGNVEHTGWGQYEGAAPTAADPGGRRLAPPCRLKSCGHERAKRDRLF